MTNEVDENEIRRIVATVLAVQLPPTAALSREAEPKWDSLKHVQIIFTLEDAFDIRFDEDEMPKLTTLAALTAAVKRHRHAA